MKENVKVGTILIDDCKHLYEVVEVFKNTCVVCSYPNDGDFASEIMTYRAMENEGWKVVNSSL